MTYVKFINYKLKYVVNFVVLKNIIGSINQIRMTINCLCKCHVYASVTCIVKSEESSTSITKYQLKCGSEIRTINFKNGTLNW